MHFVSKATEKHLQVSGARTGLKRHFMEPLYLLSRISISTTVFRHHWSFMKFSFTLAEAMGAIAALEIDALAILTPFDRFGVGASATPVLEALRATGRPGGPTRPSTSYHT